MKTKHLIPLNKAIAEAIKFGFKNRFVVHNGFLHSILRKQSFPECDFAVVKCYPVTLRNRKEGEICYVVLKNGELGFIIKEMPKVKHFEEDPEEAIENTDYRLENIY